MIATSIILVAAAVHDLALGKDFAYCHPSAPGPTMA
jgi:hypothetical protein